MLTTKNDDKRQNPFDFGAQPLHKGTGFYKQRLLTITSFTLQHV